jgi:hypothetical protein
MGITAYEDTFKSKNTYENILTGINKEDVHEFVKWIDELLSRSTLLSVIDEPVRLLDM